MLKIKKEIKEYFKILEPDFPMWLDDYIETDELLKQQYISMTCGIIYSDLFDIDYFYSSLDHSIGVALIIWHFTHDKKQTLSSLFHDIATPCFKHCIDFMNGDYINQESTEDFTTNIIKNSKQIMKLLERDNIKIEEIDIYHLYPIADNDTPMLSSDRLEYSLSNALFSYKIAGIDEIRRIYSDIEIQTNENNDIELGFKTKKYAREFVKIVSKLSIKYIEDKARYSMQFISDIMKRLKDDNKIKIEDLYNKKESEIIKIINKSKYKNQYDVWVKSKRVKVSKKNINNVYCVHQNVKIRYINPLYCGKRMSDECKIVKKMIDKVLSFDMNNYVYIDSINL